MHTAAKEMFHSVMAHLLQTLHTDVGLRSARQSPLAVAPRECHTCVDSPDEQQREEGMFPTAAKERAKERKRQGVEVKKKKKSVVDDHYDDCGTSLEGLGHYVEA